MLEFLQSLPRSDPIASLTLLFHHTEIIALDLIKLYPLTDSDTWGATFSIAVGLQWPAVAATAQESGSRISFVLGQLLKSGNAITSRTLFGRILVA